MSRSPASSLCSRLRSGRWNQAEDPHEALKLKDKALKALKRSPFVYAGIGIAVLFAVGCVLAVVLVSSGPEWSLRVRLLLAFLVSTPFWLSVIAALGVSRFGRQDFQLSVDPICDNSTCPEHVSMDEDLWERRRAAILTSWEYEKDRVLQSQPQRGLQALVFGDIAALALACSVIVLPWAFWPEYDIIACSVAAAATTAFLVSFGRIMLRISGGDATSRTFAWATRSLVLVVMADIGLYVILKGAGISASVNGALLLGTFVGATGDKAIQLLLDRGGQLFKTSKTDTAPKSSPLLDIDGITAAHADRLEEEGILSVHDLAFVPTARLFFATAYSLQQICDWQDRALLIVYVGKKSADALAEKMGIRGVIDLRSCMHKMEFGRAPSSANQADANKNEIKETREIKETLQKTLGLDDGGFAELLKSMVHDEATMRVRYYWGSTVAPKLDIETIREICRPLIDVGRPAATTETAAVGRGALPALPAMIPGASG